MHKEASPHHYQECPWHLLCPRATQGVSVGVCLGICKLKVVRDSSISRGSQSNLRHCTPSPTSPRQWAASAEGQRSLGEAEGTNTRKGPSRALSISPALQELLTYLLLSHDMYKQLGQSLSLCCTQWGSVVVTYWAQGRNWSCLSHFLPALPSFLLHLCRLAPRLSTQALPTHGHATFGHLFTLPTAALQELLVLA